MTKESFLDTVSKQYINEIQGAYAHCEIEHGSQVDYKKLNLLLKKLLTHAKVDGLSAKEFIELVKGTLPGVSEKVDFTMNRAA